VCDILDLSTGLAESKRKDKVGVDSAPGRAEFRELKSIENGNLALRRECCNRLIEERFFNELLILLRSLKILNNIKI